MYSGSFRPPRPANWEEIESELKDGLPTRSFPTSRIHSRIHNAGGGRRVLRDEGEDVEHKALPQTLKPDEEESAVPPKRRSSHQPEETQKAIVRLTLEGHSPSDINVLLAQGGFRNSTGLWTKSAGSDLMVIKRIIAKNGLKEGGSTSAAAPAAAAAAPAAAAAAPAPGAATPAPEAEPSADDRAEDDDVVDEDDDTGLLPAPIKALKRKIGNEDEKKRYGSGRPASSLHHMLSKAPFIPCLAVTNADDISDKIASAFVKKMISAKQTPTRPEVIGEGTKGDMYNVQAFDRASSTGTYAVSNGFVEHGSDILGFMHFAIANPDYYTFVHTVRQGMKMEQMLRDAWQARFGNLSEEIFLAQPNRGSAGGMGVPDIDARKFVMYFYSHQMNDMDKARKKAKHGKIKS